MSEQEVQENEVPELLEIDDNDIGYTKREYPTLKQGWMPMEILSGKKVCAKTGTIMKDLLASPTDAEGSVVKGAKAKLRVIIPKKNVAHPGHKEPNTVFGCYMTARAFDPEFPRYARKVEGRPGMYEMPDGSVVNQDDAFFYNGGTKDRPNPNSVDAQVKKWAVGVYNNDDALIGERFYGCVTHETGNDGRIWATISKTRATPPEDEPVITEKFFVGEE